MNRVIIYLVLGTFWILASFWMYLSGDAENQISAAILLVLGCMFYWSAYKMFKDPSLAKKKNKNLIEKIADLVNEKKIDGIIVCSNNIADTAVQERVKREAAELEAKQAREKEEEEKAVEEEYGYGYGYGGSGGGARCAVRAD